jgi:hypothetical protein
MLDHEIAVQLRQRGWDVESIQGDKTELMGVEDAVVLERSTAMGRTLVTDNVRHFMPLHERHLSEHKSHAGLLLADSRSCPRSKRTIGIWVQGLEATLEKNASTMTANLCVWLP